MTESAGQPGITSDGGETSGLGAGAMLRQAREAAGIHVETLAVTLKVPVWKLEAIESNRWDLLPDAVFARALTASICRTLKVDTAQVLGKLPSATPRLLPQDDGINAPFRGAAGFGAGSSTLSHLSRPVVLAVLALLLGALILILWPSLQPLSMKQPSGPSDARNSSDPVASLPPVQSAPSVLETPALPASPEIVPGSLKADSLPGQMPAFPVAAASAVDATEIADLTKATANLQPRSAETLVVFKTTGPSWIQVTDARGTVALKKLMGPGESATATGLLPLAILVGRVDATTVEVGGKPFDMTAIARENVARFEVRQ